MEKTTKRQNLPTEILIGNKDQNLENEDQNLEDGLFPY